jgi:hypothetical protein
MKKVKNHSPCVRLLVNSDGLSEHLLPVRKDGRTNGIEGKYDSFYAKIELQRNSNSSS